MTAREAATQYSIIFFLLLFAGSAIADAITNWKKKP